MSCFSCHHLLLALVRSESENAQQAPAGVATCCQSSSSWPPKDPHEWRPMLVRSRRITRLYQAPPERPPKLSKVRVRAATNATSSFAANEAKLIAWTQM